MACETYREINLKAASKVLIAQCNEIIAKYDEQNLRLTLRQLYYQLVVANIIPNAEKSYKSLSGLVSDGRLCGKIDWNAIEDRVRVPVQQSEFEDLNALVEAACFSYRLPRWAGQDNYVELWVEKDALAGVLRPLARKYHVTMMVNRGYSSQSAMYESANRFKEKQQLDNGEKKWATLLYLGDLDPSGEDMVRDIGARFQMFGVDNFEIKKIALTPAQVKQYNPPPNPAKMSDPRATDYVAKHGKSSWEVDALPPNILTAIISKEIEALLDADKYEAVKALEELDKVELKKATAKLTKKLKQKE